MANDNILLFARKEVKFVLNSREYERIKAAIAPYVLKDEFGEYTICNVYFDNDDDTLIRTSLDKPRFKQKLRLRSYGIPSDSDKVFLEIKKKYAGVVYKRRIKIAYSQAKEYVYGGKIPEGFQENTSFKEIDYFMKEYKLYPKVYLAYDREAFFCKDDTSLRITFDKNVRSRYENPSLSCGDYGQILIPRRKNGIDSEPPIIMELKVSNALPVWLADVLCEQKIFKSSFSKYGNVYINRFADKRNELSA